MTNKNSNKDVVSVILAAKEAILRALVHESSQSQHAVAEAGRSLLVQLLQAEELDWQGNNKNIFIPMKSQIHFKIETVKILLGTLLAGGAPDLLEETYPEFSALDDKIYAMGNALCSNYLPTQMHLNGTPFDDCIADDHVFIPHDFQELCATYPAIKLHIKALEEILFERFKSKAAQLPCALEVRHNDLKILHKTFNKAIAMQHDIKVNDPCYAQKQEFFHQITFLAERTTAEFQRQNISFYHQNDRHFSFNACKKVANSCLKLAKKIRLNTLTLHDIEAFEKGSYKLSQTYAWFKAIVRTMMTLATFIVVGAGIGLIAGPAGAVAGGIMGFAAGIGGAMEVAKRYPVKFFQKAPVANIASEIAKQTHRKRKAL